MSEKTCKYRLVKCSDEVPYTNKEMTSDEVEAYVIKFGALSKGADPVDGQAEFSSFLEAKADFDEAIENPDFVRIMEYPSNKLIEVYSIYLEEVEVDEDGDVWTSDIIASYYPPHV